MHASTLLPSRRMVGASFQVTVMAPCSCGMPKQAPPISEPLTSHDDWVSSLAISADGRCIASGSADGTIRLWNAETGTAIGEQLTGHEGLVRSVAISADGRRIVSGSADGTIRCGMQTPPAPPLAASWLALKKMQGF